MKEPSEHDPEPPPETDGAADELEAAGNFGQWILIVDDEARNRKLLAFRVQRICPSVEIAEAGDGREALRKLSALREKTGRDPLFVVTDLEMPAMDGWELIDALERDYRRKGRKQGFPVIVMSATGGEKDVFMGRKSVHAGESSYSPLVTVAKDSCIAPQKYDGVGAKGIEDWLRHFLRFS